MLWLAVISSIGPLKRLDRRGRAERDDRVGEHARDRGRVGDQADDREQRDQRGEDRQDGVVGERGRPVGEVVLLELAEGALERVLPGPLGEIGRVVGARSDASPWEGSPRRARNSTLRRRRRWPTSRPRRRAPTRRRRARSGRRCGRGSSGRGRPRHGAVVALERVLEHLDRLDVEVVGGLVEHEAVGRVGISSRNARRVRSPPLSVATGRRTCS